MELDRRKTIRKLNIPLSCFCKVRNAIDVDTTFNNFLVYVSAKAKESAEFDMPSVIKRRELKVVLKTYGIHKQHYGYIINSMAGKGLIQPVNKQKIRIL